MSKATKRKHVVREVEQEFSLPTDKEEIVQVIAGKGNNLHEVKKADGEIFLVSMPSKFRRNVWIKRGDFVVVCPIAEGDKVKGEITKILYKDQISYIKQEGKWPHQFFNRSGVEQATEKIDNLNISTDECDKSSGEDTDDDLFKNTNRPSYQYESETSSSNDESNDDEEIEKRERLTN